MPKQILALGLVLLALCAGGCQENVAADNGHGVLPAITHRNLSIYLIEGPPTANQSEYLTLKDGLDQGLVVVHETGTVGELAIENKSDKLLYVGSGEIVKGGRQDRVLQNDMIVAANSEKMPLPAFCVERGRWSERTGEAGDRFATSDKMIPNKEIKMAAKVAQSQGEVWNEVAELRADLDAKAGVFIRGGRAGESLYGLIDDREVGNLTDSYLEAFRELANRHPEAIGFAYAIGNSINSAEIYSSHSLFARLWPKLIDAAAVEAASHFDSTQTFVAPGEADVSAWLARCEQSTPEEREVNELTSVRRYHSDDGTLFETIEAGTGDVLHRSYLHK